MIEVMKTTGPNTLDIDTRGKNPSVYFCKNKNTNTATLMAITSGL